MSTTLGTVATTITRATVEEVPVIAIIKARTRTVHVDSYLNEIPTFSITREVLSITEQGGTSVSGAPTVVQKPNTDGKSIADYTVTGGAFVGEIKKLSIDLDSDSRIITFNNASIRMGDLAGLIAVACDLLAADELPAVQAAAAKAAADAKA